MRIGFDAKRAAQNRTGLGNYSRFVIRGLQESFPDNQYVAYVPNERRMQYFDEIPSRDKIKVCFPMTKIWRHFRSQWRVFGITDDIKRDGIDIFHGLSNELPLNIRKAGCKSVVTIHDLIFLHYPKYYHLIDRKIYNYKFRRACENADRVIAVSEFTKQEIIRYYGIDERKIDVVYQGCDPVFAKDVSDETKKDVSKRHNLPERFLLYVGSIEERKNLLLAVKAVAMLHKRGEDVNIVAVGRRTPYLDEIVSYAEANGISHLLHIRHGVNYADLPVFYKLATAFVYPSRIEGFGIPMLEAITSGLPAIGCTGSCLEEAGGPSSLYVNPDDAEGMAAAIHSVFTDISLRENMISQGKEYARRFDISRLSNDLYEVYKKVVSTCSTCSATSTNPCGNGGIEGKRLVK